MNQLLLGILVALSSALPLRAASSSRPSLPSAPSVPAVPKLPVVVQPGASVGVPPTQLPSLRVPDVAAVDLPVLPGKLLTAEGVGLQAQGLKPELPQGAPGAVAAGQSLDKAVEAAQAAPASEGEKAKAGFDAAFDAQAEAPDAASAGSAGSTAIKPEDIPTDKDGNEAIVPGHLEPLIPPPADKDLPNWTDELSLHLHTIYSDGTMQPRALVRELHRQGVREFAITDHDSIGGVLEAYDEVKKINAEMIAAHGAEEASKSLLKFHPGVEISAGPGIHIVALDFDVANPQLGDALRFNQEGRGKRAEVFVKALNNLPELKDKGIVITMEEVKKVAGPAPIGRPHIARVLVDKGVVSSVDEAFNTVFKKIHSDEEKVSEDVTPEVAAAAIHAAGGMGFLAHAYTMKKNGKMDTAAISRVLNLKGIGGIEVYRPTHATSDKWQEIQRKDLITFLILADKYNLAVLPGPDYHGPDTHLNEFKVLMPKILAEQLRARLAPLHEQALAALDKASQPAPRTPPEPSSPAAASSKPVAALAVALLGLTQLGMAGAGVLPLSVAVLLGAAAAVLVLLALSQVPALKAPAFAKGERWLGQLSQGVQKWPVAAVVGGLIIAGVVSSLAALSAPVAAPVVAAAAMLHVITKGLWHDHPWGAFFHLLLLSSFAGTLGPLGAVFSADQWALAAAGLVLAPAISSWSFRAHHPVLGWIFNFILLDLFSALIVP